jgi:TrmH family RNA methyltransferase
MPEVAVVLVEPKIEGNIGAVARAMKNFGLYELRIVKPCNIGDEAYKRAKHARGILEAVKCYDCLEDALEGCSLVAGTSGIETPSERYFLRISMRPREFVQRITEHEGKLAILFGREDLGLFNEELKRCDILVNIPTNDEYPILNVSHAATIVFYELYQAGFEKRPLSEITELEREKLIEFFRELLVATRHAEHTRERTEVMFRRLIGRAVLTNWEYHVLMGVLGDAVKGLKKADDS